jgi:hypothetical protein
MLSREMTEAGEIVAIVFATVILSMLIKLILSKNEVGHFSQMIDIKKKIFLV